MRVRTKASLTLEEIQQAYRKILSAYDDSFPVHVRRERYEKTFPDHDVVWNDLWGSKKQGDANR
jgi:hypothetical protein